MPKIMLAEDDPTMLSLLRTLLKMEGFETVTLGEQENVLDAIRREQPDLLLMDVHLTHYNGLNLLGEIRTEAALTKLFVIMQSGMNLEAECKAAGADTFLLKPYMPDTLINSIKEGLKSRSL